MLLVLLLPWQAFGKLRNRSIGPLVSVIRNGRQRRISTEETNNKKALRIAEEFEQAAKTKRTLKQVQNVLDRLDEEVSGQRVVRTTFREYLSDSLMAKKAETASSTMDFYQTSLRKFVHFLGQRADEPIGEASRTARLCFAKTLGSLAKITPVEKPRVSQSYSPVVFLALPVPTSNSRRECDLTPFDPSLPNSKVHCAHLRSSELIHPI